LLHIAHFVVLQIERERNELEEQAMHEKWLAQQKRLVREAKIKRTLVKELGPELAAQYLNQADGQPGARSPPLRSPLPDPGNAMISSRTDEHPHRELVSSPSVLRLVRGMTDDGRTSAAGTPPSSAFGRPAGASSGLDGRYGAGGGSPVEAPADNSHIFNLVPEPVLSSQEMEEYDPTGGMHLFFDFATGLPPKASAIQVAFCFYAGETPIGTVQLISALATEPDAAISSKLGQELSRCMLAQQSSIDGDAGSDIVLVIEVQRVMGAEVRSVGWCIIPLFRYLRKSPFNEDVHSCFARALRLPLFKPPVSITGDVFASIRNAVPVPNVELCVRLLTHAQYCAMLDRGRTLTNASDAAVEVLKAARSLFDVDASARPLAQKMMPRFDLIDYYKPASVLFPSGPAPAPAPPVVPSLKHLPDPTSGPPLMATVDTTPVQELAWCDVTHVQPPQIVFDRHTDGFDLYVDAARFLPDNVTVSKVVVKLLTSSFGPIGSPMEGLGTLDCDILSPRFDLVTRFAPFYTGVPSSPAAGNNETVHVVRIPAPIDPTTTAVIRVDTVESHTHNVQVAGYSVLNIFAFFSGSTTDQPGFVNPPPGAMSKSAAVLDGSAITPSGHISARSEEPGAHYSVVLNAGAFQLPVHQIPPLKSAPLHCMCLDNTPRVPCATVLVRLSHIPGAASMPELERAVPRLPSPAYATQVYDSSRCRPMPAEVLLYPKRADISAPRVFELLDHYSEQGGRVGLPILDGPITGPLPTGVDSAAVPADTISFGVPPPATKPADERKAWIGRRIGMNPSSMLDFLFLTPYDASMGFKVRVDGVNNVPQRGQSFVKVLHCVHPPGAFYNEPPDTSISHFSQTTDWTNSSSKFQRFKDGYAVQVGVPFSPALCVILVRKHFFDNCLLLFTRFHTFTPDFMYCRTFVSLVSRRTSQW
jgi:hypothetical protein